MTDDALDVDAELDGLERIAIFRAYIKGTSTAESTGELKLSLGVPMEFKKEAMEVTDHPGVMFTVIMAKRPRRTAAYTDDGEDDDGD